MLRTAHLCAPHRSRMRAAHRRPGCANALAPLTTSCPHAPRCAWRALWRDFGGGEGSGRGPRSARPGGPRGADTPCAGLDRKSVV